MAFTIFAIYLIIDLNKNKTDFNEISIVIQQNENNYASVTNAKEFIEALEKNNIQILESKNDIDLGYNYLEQE